MFAVVRTDLMTGTDVASELRSFCYRDAEGNAKAIENGNVVMLDGLMKEERELWLAKTPKADTPLKDIVLVATPEVMYDERKKNLDEFVNEAGKPARGYILHTNDIFSVTIEALSAASTPAVDDIVELQADTKLKVVASATSGSTTVGKIIAIETAGKYTYYVIKVD